MTGVIWLDRPVVAGSPADRLVQLSGIPFRPTTPKIGHPFALAGRTARQDWQRSAALAQQLSLAIAEVSPGHLFPV